MEVQEAREEVPTHHWSKMKSETGRTERGKRNSFTLPVPTSPKVAQLRAKRDLLGL